MTFKAKSVVLGKGGYGVKLYLHNGRAWFLGDMSKEESETLAKTINGDKHEDQPSSSNGCSGASYD